MKRILLLGASGSIGQQTLDVIASNHNDFSLVAFSVGEKVDTISKILRTHPEVKYVCIKHKEYIDILKKQFPMVTFFSGDQGLIKIVRKVECDLVVNALVGFAGFPPTIAALKKKRTICLANKESLVIGGEIVNRLLKKGFGKIYPIDSEHVAIAKCLSRTELNRVEKIILTASGGAFRDLTIEQMAQVTPQDALKHPTWQMGSKITIDSATMMNKGFEIIEAYYLFGFPLDKIEVLMHDESYVHSLVKLKDGGFLAEVSKPDMRTPIAYALYEGQNQFEVTSADTIDSLGPYHFRPFASDRYPCVSLAKQALIKGGTALSVLNASNEVAVYAFLENRLPFLMISKIIEKEINNVKVKKQTIRNVIQADKKTRLHLRKVLGN
ncbi:MAG: 1-deoxy-D-xylulose-5-phosphate reductoisomerase [Bacilli bacterium]|jgi:1-deoxy-D-xylulose-5-phosphate reductoisomerase|nr:1-deoxy-D-xylulose-5-phosphate reductoisomerase [Bacilli bacterium]MDD4005706.1 1-deoxy-D-xylulose-5-phosphate reductoisomerase [Bacilli bacterium]